ncbi:MAG: class I SAM-dependent methyltransferase [Acidobacteria bacterium]|nr:class I SAM-dependent methyltransferase [Acidobacteriota bacterium]
MSAERLRFEPERMGYQWMVAAEHLARYAFAAEFCAGRRVLDVACGEGYGSALLARAGARAVVGVDVAAEAIASADARFAAPGVRYLVGDATDLPAVLEGEAPFDLVVSFETIEHVPDVERFLDGIRAVLAPDGIVIISAPNEPDPAGQGSANPYHRRAFSFDRFREVTEGHLGEARRWYVGTPLQGMVVAEVDTALLLNDRSDLGVMVDTQPAARTWLLPAQRELQVSKAGCAFFVGVWGADAGAVVAASPASLAGVLEPWKALEWFKAENARLLRDLDALATVARPSPADARSRTSADVVADLRRRALLDKGRIERTEADLADARRALEAAESGRFADRARTRQAEQDRDAAVQAAAARERALLAETARLGMLVEHHAQSACALRAEIAGLRAAPAPALRSDDERLESEVHALSARLQAIEASRSWRLVQAYTRLLARPVLGAPLRLVRRVLGA